jgi:hypothetical protein
VIAAKINQMYERIRVPEAKSLARPMWEAAVGRLSRT